ncbi:glutamate N-acetyltransferase [Cyclonatronum proteinivorum]|uniref:Arginine biosynthesis bifunctional protein ArgJ n=1 Tax=Cyclonatronum proteinivorum TaxID=1457365 RepID=A0A345UIV9_9BACT|nr:bifunctional glutamate N-acetyltransferase/amino-acid acetyltransferase ArgJ [Cyclonatronum proteinivorum]AXJ00411.1 glutamate N-acetyltransferase [Cyclonatronum proteinivorum]
MENITNVRGFRYWGAHTGVKSKRRDLGLIVSDKPASAAAVFTRNVVVAEPIKICREHIKNGRIQAIVINSGNANACTGKQGYIGAQAMIAAVSEELNIPREQILVASTGVIGRELPTEKIVAGIRENAAKLTSRKVAGSLLASAILTTDTFPKEGFVRFRLGDTEINMGAVAKGSGMIHPNMGTMLGFIMCDAAIKPELLQEMLGEVVNDTFNMITVDGDTSTNDMVAILSNGAAGNEEITEKDESYALFKTKLFELCEHLARMIVSDGEGASKLIEYRVKGLAAKDQARQIIRTVSDSALVKTALFGRDPNWGRIVAAAGRAGVSFDPDKTDLYISADTEIQILKGGQPLRVNLNELKRLMRSTEIAITLHFNQGEAEAKGWGCDLSYEYVRINAEYTT